MHQATLKRPGRSDLDGTFSITGSLVTIAQSRNISPKNFAAAPNVRLRTESPAGWSLEFNRQPRIELADSQFHASRRLAIREDIAKRLRHACAHLTPEEFQHLVDQMAETQLRSERRVVLE